MKFSEALTFAIQQAEIPLRFEPGAEDAILEPVSALVRAWLEAHEPAEARDDFELGQKALVRQLLDELDGRRELPE